MAESACSGKQGSIPSNDRHSYICSSMPTMYKMPACCQCSRLLVGAGKGCKETQCHLPVDVEGGSEVLVDELALPSSLMPEPLKATKLGSACSGSEVLSAHSTSQ